MSTNLANCYSLFLWTKLRINLSPKRDYLQVKQYVKKITKLFKIVSIKSLSSFPFSQSFLKIDLCALYIDIFHFWLFFATGLNRKPWISIKHMPLALPSLKAPLLPWYLTDDSECYPLLVQSRQQPREETRVSDPTEIKLFIWKKDFNFQLSKIFSGQWKQNWWKISFKTCTLGIIFSNFRKTKYLCHSECTFCLKVKQWSHSEWLGCLRDSSHNVFYDYFVKYDLLVSPDKKIITSHSFFSFLFSF